MKSLIAYFIKYPAWPNVIKILVLAFGLAAVLSLRSSLFPEIETRIINIQAIYPGASPLEIERGVIDKIEDNLVGIVGVERFTSKSMENSGSITIEILKGYEVDGVLTDVKNAVDRINSFPDDMEPPVVFKAQTINPAISYTISGGAELKTLKAIARKAEDELRSLPEISQVDITGFPEEEIVILLKEETLRAYNLTFNQVATAVAASNLDLTGGSIKTEEEEIIIRLEQKDYYAEGLQDIVITATPEGRVARLKDVAIIENRWEESPKQILVDGKPAIRVQVNKILGENIIEVVEAAKAYFEEFNEEYDIVEAKVLENNTIPLQERLQMLINSAALGASLILMALWLFLSFRLSFWVALGLPFSFLGLFLVMYIAGITINAISLFGCIVVIGILVDDAIVIAEQIYQNYEAGEKPYKAAFNGALQVLPSVVFAILTTITIFLPFFFFQGTNGEWMRDLAFVVVVTIIFSLIESALILPSHLAHSKALRKVKKNKIREKLNKALLWPRDVIYAKSLRFFMRYRIAVIAMAFAITLITVSAFRGGIIQFTFFPFLDFDSFEIYLQMPAGTRENVTKDILKKIEKSVWEVNAELKSKREDNEDVIKRAVIEIARAQSGLFGAVTQGSSNQGIIKVILMGGDKRGIESFKIANMIREKTGPVYEAEKLIFGGGSGFGKPVSVPLISPNLADVKKAAAALKDSLRNFPQLKDIEDNNPVGLREIKISLKPQARLLGFSNLELARQIRQGYFGAEIQRLQRGEDEIKVWARYTESDRSSISKFENIRARLPNGNEYPLKEIADFKIERGIMAINHIDGLREIRVEAEMVDQRAPVPPVVSKVNNEILPKILERYPTVSTGIGGQSRELQKFQKSSRMPMMIALVLIFFLITLSFRSFSQALLVFALIPLGFIGGIWGHFIHGEPVSIMSTYGFIALIGVIVNNSIVFVNTMNKYLAEGKPFEKAVFKTSITRYRPIVLTTLTTVLGLYPLIFSTGLQATFLVPMAIAVAYGLLIGSFFVLLFLPIFLILLNDTKRAMRWLFTGRLPEKEEVEPAIKEVKNIEKYFGDEKIS